MVWNMNFIFHLLGMSSSQLTNSDFSEGLKPPNRYDIAIVVLICQRKTSWKRLTGLTNRIFRECFEWYMVAGPVNSCLESLFVTFTSHSRPSTNHLAFIWRLWVHRFWEVYEQGPCGSANWINSVNSQRFWVELSSALDVWCFSCLGDTLETWL